MSLQQIGLPGPLPRALREISEFPAVGQVRQFPLTQNITEASSETVVFPLGKSRNRYPDRSLRNLWVSASIEAAHL